METILEQQRRYHEERERLVDAMVKEMLHKKTSVSHKLNKNLTSHHQHLFLFLQYRETINSDHRLKYLLDKFLTSTERLVDLYEDKDGQRKAEVAALTGPNEFQEFYNRLKQIKDFYRKHPNEVCLGEF